jgi:hypothetical protein
MTRIEIKEDVHQTIASSTLDRGLLTQTMTASALILFLLPSLNLPIPSNNYTLSTSSELSKLLPNENRYEFADSSSEDAERLSILRDFADKLLGNTKDMDPEIAKIVNDNFWDLYEPF